MTRKGHDKDTKQPRRVRVGKLKSAQDVARYMARVIKRVEGGADGGQGYKLTMMASMLLKAIETSTLERRIERLESTINAKGGKQL